MSGSVERPRYYEQQYLRSFDLEAEQNYHLEMRRRLNRALHRHGIAYGLELLEFDGATEPEGFYINTGMAIDGYGREILVALPRRLDSDDLVENRVQRAGTYGVWLAYDRAAGTPPESGYEVCNLGDQYTRWRESFRVLITEEPPPPFDSLGGAPLPEIVGALPDDPEVARWPVRLGNITVQNLGSLLIVGAVSTDRDYVGATAQSLHTPDFEPDPSAPATFDVLSAASPMDPPLSVAIADNAFAEHNLVVGDNFEIDQSKVDPAPGGVFPGSGNLKVAGNLFLNGAFYSQVGGEWLRLDKLVKTLVPEIKTGTTTLITAPGADPSSGTEIVSVPTSLSNTTSAELIVSIAGVELIPINTMFGDWLAADGNADIIWSVRVVGPPVVNGANRDFTVAWEVGPRSNVGPTLHVRSLTVSWIAIFAP